ncbi:hypothetical protein EVAR_76300_1 [Eumeta japonica]|uniref:Uncharacterized protein n=1 Tax=Eumeta variegata TaxID=151549 RepID=A0A4C1UP50_EUMVA|nr:hypothetical protein EVAR_76300_1 [Eumeta japonica]
MVSDENHEFLFDVTARSKSRAIPKSPSNGAKDGHHVWMSSQTMRCPRSRKRGHGWLAAVLGRSRSGPRWQRGLWFTHGWRRGERRQGVGLFPARSGSYLDPESYGLLWAYWD